MWTRRLKPLLAPLLYGSLAIPLVAAGLVLGTYALLDLPPSRPLLVVACCGAFLVYQAERVLLGGPEDRFNHPERTAWLRRHTNYVAATTAIALVGGLVALPLLRPATVLAGALLAVPGLLYALPLGAQGKRLKTVWHLKPLLIAGVWAAGAVVLPVLEAGVPLATGVAVLVLYRIGYVLPNAFLADWPDRRGDARAGLRTPATEWTERGLVRRSLAFAAAPLLLGGALLLPRVSPGLLVVDLGGPVLVALLTAGGLPTGRWFYGVTLDLLVAWPLVTAVAAWLT